MANSVPEEFRTSFLPDSPLHRNTETKLREGVALSRAILRIYYQGFLRSIEGGQDTDFSRFKGIETAFFLEASRAARRNLAIAVEMHGKVDYCGPEERILLIGNHPMTRLAWVWNDAITEHVAPGRCALAKKDLLKLRFGSPFFGLPIKLAGLAEFLTRNNSELDREIIRQACETIFTTEKAMVLFLDAHRPTKEKMDKDVAKFAPKYPPGMISRELLRYTCMPRTGGLMDVLEATEEVEGMRIINSTVGESRPGKIGSTYHVKLEEVTREELFNKEHYRALHPEADEVTRRQALQGWLFNEWFGEEGKNNQLGEWQSAA